MSIMYKILNNKTAPVVPAPERPHIRRYACYLAINIVSSSSSHASGTLVHWLLFLYPIIQKEDDKNANSKETSVRELAVSGIFAHRRIEAAGRYYKEKRIYESFTSDIPGPKGKRMAEKMAAEFAVRKEQLSRETPDLTLGEAMDNYINSRKAVLSPRTIMDYERMRSKDF